MHTSVRREPSSAAIESARDSSTRALERTRPGERPPARGTARTIPRFSSMTPPSMHSSLLRILCICGTGCTSECQKIDFSTPGARPTRPGERPPARWTARTVPRFSSMTPPSMHSLTLHILCICGGCTSECQKDRLQHARRTTHTVTGGSPAAAFTWTRCVVRRDDSRASRYLWTPGTA